MTIPGMERTASLATECRALASTRWVLLTLVFGLAACNTPPASQAPPVGVAPASAASAPATDTQGAASPPVEAQPAPVLSLSPQELQRSMSAALDHLQAGQEEQAESELARILQSDPNNRLAASLMRQIKDDPVASLGRESFAYRVQPGESLSRIAQRFMNDLHLFYILARYNNIKVPRNLAGGQMIRVPGKAPVAGSAAAGPAAPPAAAPAPAAIPAPAPAPAAAAPASAATSADAAATSRAARQRSEAVTRHTRAARAAFAKQDLDAAIKSWDAVLEIDPENRTAQLERQKVLGLKEKLGKVK